MSHRCPGPACPRSVPDRLLACAKHWARVSATTQRDVYYAYRRYGTGSPQHDEAIQRAISEMGPSLQ